MQSDTRAGLIRQLHECSRRLRQAGSGKVWALALREAASAFCVRSAVVLVRSGRLSFLGSPVDVPLASAPALANALESGDTVVAMATEGQLSKTLLEAAELTPRERVWLLPVLDRAKPAAVLMAAGGEVDVDALELLAALAAGAPPPAEDEAGEEQEPPVSGLIRIAPAPRS